MESTAATPPTRLGKMSDPPAFDDAQIVYLDEHYSGQSSANVHWMIFNGVLVFLMQCGFAMLCAGSVRAKNAQNILLKNLVDTCVGAMGFWATGYAFAYYKNEEEAARAVRSVSTPRL